MKRLIDMLTLFTAIWAVFSGISESDIHEAIGYAFIGLFVAHAFLYRKLLVNHMKSLGWKWALVAAGLLVIILSSFGGDIGENGHTEEEEYGQSLPSTNGLPI